MNFIIFSFINRLFNYLDSIFIFSNLQYSCLTCYLVSQNHIMVNPSFFGFG
jgi:hypothetical protein